MVLVFKFHFFSGHVTVCVRGYVVVLLCPRCDDVFRIAGAFVFHLAFLHFVVLSVMMDARHSCRHHTFSSFDSYGRHDFTLPVVFLC